MPSTSKNLRWRIGITLVVVVVCIYGFAGFPPSLKNIKERIRLGLDLKGGTHLVLQVVTDDAVNFETDETIQQIRQMFTEKNIYTADIRKRDLMHVEVRGIDGVGATEFRDWFDNRYAAAWERSSLPGDPNGFLLSMKSLYASDIRTQAVKQAVQTLRNRIDQLGVTEPVIQEHGVASDYEILVQLPGVDDPEKVDRIIQSTAVLELKLVREGPFPSQQAAMQAKGGTVPDSLLLLRSVERRAPGEDPSRGETWYLVDRVATVTGRDLRTARPSLDENGRPAVSFSLNNAGAQRFSQVTEQNVGRQLAIVLDGKIQSAPTIQSRISDSGQITGQFTQAQADELALILRSGALPASIKYLQKVTVGPSLGNDSIRQGVMASIAGMTLVVIFMLVYYKFSGFNAVVALVINLFILLAALAYFQATLTLPGIAGVILTIGMGVDSNVLVFERIREELRQGKIVVSAVSSGFQKAFLTIIDTHVTTIVSALFLFLFGTGPVKGFAVTLSVGLVSNVFTAVFVSRVIFDWVLGRKPRHETLSI